jgi:hypothetical protein
MDGGDCKGLEKSWKKTGSLFEKTTILAGKSAIEQCLRSFALKEGMIARRARGGGGVCRVLFSQFMARTDEG